MLCPRIRVFNLRIVRQWIINPPLSSFQLVSLKHPFRPFIHNVRHRLVLEP